MKTVFVKDYEAKRQIQKGETSMGYLFSGITGMIAGVITFLRLDMSSFGAYLVSLLSALLFGAMGAAGKYFFDKWAKKKIDRILSKIFKRKKR